MRWGCAQLPFGLWRAVVAVGDAPPPPLSVFYNSRISGGGEHPPNFAVLGIPALPPRAWEGRQRPNSHRPKALSPAGCHANNPRLTTRTSAYTRKYPPAHLLQRGAGRGVRVRQRDVVQGKVVRPQVHRKGVRKVQEQGPVAVSGYGGGGGRGVFEKRRGGVWDPKFCVPKTARPDFPTGKFRVFQQWSLWWFFFGRGLLLRLSGGLMHPLGGGVPQRPNEYAGCSQPFWQTPF